jgi:ribosomal protein L37AE/L43A
MKKSIVLLAIIIAGIFIAGCAMDTISYCPYCGQGSVKEIEEGVYKCGRSSCGREFGAKEINV